MKQNLGKSEVLSAVDKTPEGFRWLTLKQIKYRDPLGRERLWEAAERVSTRGPVDGVAIIAQVTSSNKPMQIILESQFRPSQNNYVIEFPAGLVDEGESPDQAATRELKEETGYSGTVKHVSEIGYCDPGMTNSNMQVVTILVDGDAPSNSDVKPDLEDGEFIEVFLLPMEGLYKQLKGLVLQELSRAKGWDIDARLLLYALGMEHVRAAADQPGFQLP